MTTFRRSVDEAVPAVGLAPLDGLGELNYQARSLRLRQGLRWLDRFDDLQLKISILDRLSQRCADV